MRQPIKESYCHKNEILRIFPFCPFLLKCRPASCKRFASFFSLTSDRLLDQIFYLQGMTLILHVFSPQLHSVITAIFFPQTNFKNPVKIHVLGHFFLTILFQKILKKLLVQEGAHPAHPSSMLWHYGLWSFQTGDTKINILKEND